MHITLSFVKNDKREILPGKSSSQHSKKSSKSAGGEGSEGKGEEEGGVLRGLIHAVRAVGRAVGRGQASVRGASTRHRRHSRNRMSSDEQANAAEWLVMLVHDTGKSLHRRVVRGGRVSG